MNVPNPLTDDIDRDVTKGVCIPSVLALLCEDREQRLDRGFLTEHVVHRAFDLLLASRYPAPSVRPFASDGSMLI